MDMDQDEGIITVVDQNEEEEDESLAALQELPQFEPLIVPDQASHFSLASVFGALSYYGDSRNDSSEKAFDPNVLVDVLMQMNVHSKKYAQDIQEYQRSLGVRVKALEEYTTGAVQDLISIHQQAKVHSDHLLSVHALPKQAQLTTTLLHGVLDKINAIVDQLPADAGIEGPSSKSCPTLYRFLQQTSPHHSHGQGNGLIAGGGSCSESALPPSGLALLGHNATSTSRRTSMLPQNTRTAAMSIPKARASMALAPNSLTYLPVHGTSARVQDLSTSHPLDLSSSRNSISRSRTTDSSQDSNFSAITAGMGENILQQQSAQQQQQQLHIHQPTTLRASDNLRRLANKSPSNASSLGQPNTRFF